MATTATGPTMTSASGTIELPGAVRLRSTEHTIVETVQGDWFVLSSMWNRRDTLLIGIRQQSGELVFFPLRDVHVFPDETRALQRLTERGFTVKNIVRARALIGFVAIGNVGALLVATRVKPDMLLLGDHQVFTVTESEWVRIPLLSGKIDATEEKNLERLLSYPLNNYHFYCETMDLTHPFPSRAEPTVEFDRDYCWNESLVRPFYRAGLREICVVLLQGLANSKVVHFRNKELFLGHLYKKNIRNPGTRYVARGINEEGSVGNEYECEQIVWARVKKPLTPEDHRIQWTSYFWRRGTVPVRWRTELKSSISEPEIIVDQDQPTAEITKYYKGYIDRYNRIPITIINLLRCEPGHHEVTLASKFQESIRPVIAETALSIRIINFDWHTNIKKLTVPKAIEGLWMQSTAHLMESGTSIGTYLSIRPTTTAVPGGGGGGGGGGDLNDALTNLVVSETASIPDPSRAHFQFGRRQQGVLRVNCADSLDRTNACMFFICMQVLLEQCRTLGVGLTGQSNKSTADATLLATGREWCFLTLPLARLKNAFDMGLLEKLAELFVSIGDVCSFLYTNTPAMHTNVIREYAPHLKNMPNNTRIVMQRRYHNVVDDKNRQAQYEMFLGNQMESYFPSSALESKPHLVSIGSASAVLRPVPSLFPSQRSDALIKRVMQYRNGLWICPRDHDFVEVIILLEHACRVSHLVLTLPKSRTLLASPRYIDVRVGEHFDHMRVAFQRLELPRCREASELVYRFPPHISGVKSNAPLYDFEDDSASMHPYVRFVTVTLYGLAPGAHLTFGPIGIFGYVKRLSDRPIQIAAEFRHLMMKRMESDVVSTLAALEHTDLSTLDDVLDALDDDGKDLDLADAYDMSNGGGGPEKDDGRIRRIHSGHSNGSGSGVSKKGSRGADESDDDADSGAGDQDSSDSNDDDETLSNPSTRGSSQHAARTRGGSSEDPVVLKTPSRFSAPLNRVTAADESSGSLGHSVDSDSIAEPSSAGLDMTLPHASTSDFVIQQSEGPSSSRPSKSDAVPTEENAPGSTFSTVDSGADESFGDATTPIEKRMSDALSMSSPLPISSSSARNNRAAGVFNIVDDMEMIDSEFLESEGVEIPSAHPRPENANAVDAMLAAAPATMTIAGLVDAAAHDTTHPSNPASPTHHGPVDHGSTLPSKSPIAESSESVPVSDPSGAPASNQSEPGTESGTNSVTTVPKESKSPEHSASENADAVDGGTAPEDSDESNLDPYHRYKHLVRDMLDKRPNHRITFTEALELEAKRLELTLEASVRDRLLIEMSLQISDFDPNRFIWFHDEDMESRLRKSSKYQLSFCHVCDAQNLSRMSRKQCHYCRFTVCKRCVYPRKMHVHEFMWNQSTHTVCRKCAVEIMKQISLVKAIRAGLASLHDQQLQRLSYRFKLRKLLCYNAFEHPPFYVNRMYGTTAPLCVSEYPMATFLSSVPTNEYSPPAEILLYPTGIIPTEACWFSPPNLQSIDVVVVLCVPCTVDSVIITADAHGYSTHDVPSVEFTVGPNLAQFAPLGMISLAEQWRTQNPDYDVSTLPHSDCVVPPFATISFSVPKVDGLSRLMGIRFTFADSVLAVPVLATDANPSERVVSLEDGDGTNENGTAPDSVASANSDSNAEPKVEGNSNDAPVDPTSTAAPSSSAAEDESLSSATAAQQPGILAFDSSLVKVNRYFHAARLQVLGRPADVTIPPMSPGEQMELSRLAVGEFSMSMTTPRVVRSRVLESDMNTIEVTLEGGNVNGFVLYIPSDSPERFFQSVRSVRVFALQVDESNALSPQLVSEYLIPRVLQGGSSQLVFSFEEQQTAVKVFRFEFVTILPLDPSSVPKVMLFAL